MTDLPGLTSVVSFTRQGAAWLLLPWVAYIAVKAVYNLYFHPLVKYPGPSLAAASDWWQVYIEVFAARSLSEELWNLHQQYGDIVRIAPNTLHFSKPSAYQEIYNLKNRWDKDMRLYHLFAREQSTLTIPDYSSAKKRRDTIMPLFSRKNIIETQYLVQQCLNNACENIDRHIKAGKPVNIFRAFRCCAVDVIFTMCFARSINATSETDFAAPIVIAMHATQSNVVVFKHFPLLKKLVSKLPPQLLLNLRPELDGLVKMRMLLRGQVKEVKTNPQVLADYHQLTIYHELLKDRGNNLSDVSLGDEAMLLVTAGTDTAGDALTVGTLNVLANPGIHAKLLNELMEAWPNVDEILRFEQLEKLPYLTAVIKEALRFSHGVVQPMTRVVPKQGAYISGESIPGGTVVGISNIFVHLNEDIFPEPRVFKPERWLDPQADLDTYLVSFSKGPRACIGINLAWCELYIGYANIFRRYEMKLRGVGPSDWVCRDLYLPHYEGPDVVVDVKRRTV